MAKLDQQIKTMLRHPNLLVRYQATGRLPEMHNPTSPLIDLLEAIAPRDRVAIRQITLHPDLGYAGGTFHTAENLLLWLKPGQWVHGTTPADSRMDRRFRGPLYIDDLLAHSGNYPEHLAERYPRLRRPVSGKFLRP